MPGKNPFDDEHPKPSQKPRPIAERPPPPGPPRPSSPAPQRPPQTQRPVAPRPAPAQAPRPSAPVQRPAAQPQKQAPAPKPTQRQVQAQAPVPSATAPAPKPQQWENNATRPLSGKLPGQFDGYAKKGEEFGGQDGQADTYQNEPPVEDYPEPVDEYYDGQETSQQPPPQRASYQRNSQDRRLYDGYQRSKAATQAGSYRRSGEYDDSRRAAIEAYRRRKEEQGMAAPQYEAVRVARRADYVPQGRPVSETDELARKRRFARVKDKWGVAKGVTLLVVLVILFMLPFTQNVMPEVRDVLMSDLTEPQPRLFPEYADYDMQRVFGLTVNAGTVTYDLKVPVPYDIQGAQDMNEFSPTPAGNKVGTNMYWKGDADSNIQIIVGYKFRATTQKWSITPETSGTPGDVPADYKKYLGKEWKIDPTLPEIKDLAAKIAGDKLTVYEKLDAMATWMRLNILYEKQRGWQPKDPMETLNDGTGDCDDQSILFASLARSQGIPVWLEMGALYDQFQNKWGGHAWLRAYVPLTTGSGYKVNMDPANKEFLVRDPFRITEWESNGNGDDLQNYYTLWQFSYSGDADYDASANYVNIDYKRSSGTVSDKPAGSGQQAWKKSYTIPGFEILCFIPALAAALVLTRRKLRTV